VREGSGAAPPQKFIKKIRFFFNVLNFLLKIRETNFKDFNRFEAKRGSSNKKNVVFNSFVCKLGFF
jgi:hypothetical protein